jgi:hypothetical protein
MSNSMPGWHLWATHHQLVRALLYLMLDLRKHSDKLCDMRHGLRLSSTVHINSRRVLVRHLVRTELPLRLFR